MGKNGSFALSRRMSKAFEMITEYPEPITTDVLICQVTGIPVGTWRRWKAKPGFLAALDDHTSEYGLKGKRHCFARALINKGCRDMETNAMNLGLKAGGLNLDRVDHYISGEVAITAEHKIIAAGIEADIAKELMAANRGTIAIEAEQDQLSDK